MKFSDDVQRSVREALAAAIGKELDRLLVTARAIAAKGPEFSGEALNLIGAIDVYAFFLTYEGRRPSPEALTELARRMARTEEWLGVEESLYLTFLTGLADLDVANADVRPEEYAPVAFSVGAWLLAAFAPPEQEWTMFLDKILDLIENPRS